MTTASAAATAALLCLLEVVSRPVGLQWKATDWILLRMGLDGAAGAFAHSFANAYVSTGLHPYLIAVLAGVAGNVSIRSHVITLGSGESAKAISLAPPFDAVRLFLDTRIARAAIPAVSSWITDVGMPALRHRSNLEIINRYKEELSLSGQKKDSEVAELLSLVQLQSLPDQREEPAPARDRADVETVASEEAEQLQRKVLVEIIRQGGYSFLRKLAAEETSRNG